MTTVYDCVVIGGGLSSLHAVETFQKLNKAGKYTIAHILPNPFLEFTIGSSWFCTDMDQYKKFTCADKASFEFQGLMRKNLTYLYGAVIGLKPEKKEIDIQPCGQPNSIETIGYKSVIVATGCYSAWLVPSPGQTLADRVNYLYSCIASIKKAKVIILNGAGLSAVEMAGDIRLRSARDCRIIIVSRDGPILGNVFPKSGPKGWLQDHLRDVLESKYGVEIVHGTIDYGKNPQLPKNEAIFDLKGTLKGVSTVKISNIDGTDKDDDFPCCCFIPSFQMGANTQFLQQTAPDILDNSRIIVDKSTGYLQCSKHPEIFCCSGTGTDIGFDPARSHPVSSRMTALTRTVGTNAFNLLENKSLMKHVDKEGPPALPYPMAVKIGHGRGSYLYWADLPGPASILCCAALKGGFPFCPPFLCWPCFGCYPCACGYCCGENAGSGPANFFSGFLVHQFPPNHLFTGIGKGVFPPPQQEKM